MSSNLKDSVVLIRGSDRRGFGTGFAIYKDKQITCLVTCAHVIRDAGGPEGLLAHNCPAKVIAPPLEEIISSAEGGPDIVILQIDKPLEVPVFNLSISGATGQTFITAGHHQYGKLPVAEEITGRIGKEVRALPIGYISSKAWYLEISSQDQLKRGYSGAPIVTGTNWAVSGIIIYREDEEGRKGFAISTEAINNLWEKLRSHLFVKDQDSQEKFPENSPLPFLNPYFTGKTALGEKFLNHRPQLDKLKEQLLGDSWPIVVVGEPRIGKTSFLLSLQALVEQTICHDVRELQLFFSRIQVGAMNIRPFNPSKFWELALTPIKERLVDCWPHLQLAQWYYICQNNNFGYATLGTFFDLLKENKQRLVLILDNFDALITSNDSPRSAEFFEGLRKLALRNNRALMLVVSSSSPLSVLNDKIKEFSRPNTLYFEGFEQINLGSFPKSDITTFLDWGRSRFTLEDKQAIHMVAGGHPFLLQAAAAAMWEAWKVDSENISERHRSMAKYLHDGNQTFFFDTWDAWSPAKRKAFIMASLVSMTSAISVHPPLEFTIIMNDLINCRLELDDLESTGLLIYDDYVPGKWRVAEVMIWWLADEFRLALRQSFRTWLGKNQLDTVLSDEEKQHLEEAVHLIARIFQRGSETMIESFVEQQGTT